LPPQAAICDVNDKYDELMVRLNDDKVLSWLQRKTQALCSHIAQQPSCAPTGASGARAALSQFELEEEPGAVGAAGEATHAALRSSCLLVSEYLSDEWGDRLRAGLELPIGDVENRPPAKASATSPMRVVPSHQNGMPEAPPKRSEQPPPAKKVKAPEPLRKGQKTMGAFFTRKV
jgi:hypothetical protein